MTRITVRAGQICATISVIHAWKAGSLEARAGLTLGGVHGSL
ncbi:MAG TPA: hypothetical protein VGF01_01065 [Terracidiphilus sp.]